MNFPRKAIAPATGVGLVTAAICAVIGLQPSASAWGATTKPDLASPMVLLDGAAFRKSIWINFQQVVKNCMEDEGYIYRIAPVPPETSMAATLPVADPAPSTSTTSKTFNVTSSVRYEPPAVGYGGSGYVASNAPGYFLALRGFAVTSTSEKYLKSLDRQAYDGVSSAKFGSTAAETSGCEAFGRRVVSEPAVAAMQQVDLAAAPVLGDFLFSDATDEANIAWSGCMLDNVYAYHSITEPSAEINT